MKKCLIFYLAFVMLLGVLAVHPQSEVDAFGTSQYHFQPIRIYMYGEDENERTLNLSRPTSDEEQTVDCPSDGNMQGVQSTVGTWESEPVKKLTRVRAGGEFNFTIWARGDVSDVQFTVDLTIRGNNAGTFTTERKNLVEDTPIKFTASGNVQGNHSMNAGDTFSITIHFDGQETNPLNNKHAEIVFGSKDYPAGIRLEMCTIYLEHEDYEINDESDEENPETIIWDVKLYRTFGPEDVVAVAGSVHGPIDGETISLDVQHEEDMSHLKMTWGYGKDHAWSGTYQFNISVTDYNGNNWWITRRFDIVIPSSPDIDFIFKGIQVMNEKVYVDQAAIINVSIEAVGDPHLKGLAPVTYIQILNSSGEMVYDEYRTISIDTGSERVITFFWVVKVPDSYTVKVWIDYMEGEEEGMFRENNDEGTAEQNNYGETTFEAFKKESGGEEEAWYEDTTLLMYMGGGATALIVAIAVLVLFIKRRREDKEEEEKEEDIYEF